MQKTTKALRQIGPLLLLSSVLFQGCFLSDPLGDEETPKDMSPDTGQMQDATPDIIADMADMVDAPQDMPNRSDMPDMMDMSDMPQTNPLFIEAEEMALSQGFEVRQDPAASGGAWIESATMGTATHTFKGPTGRYNIQVSYFDENDGRSVLSVVIDGQVQDTWRWDLDLGSSIAEPSTRTTHTVWGVDVKTDQVLELRGQADGNEKLRVDSVKFEPCQGDTCQPPVEPSTLKPYKQVGFGASVTGGRGGKVYVVTSTSSDPNVQGSFPWALKQGALNDAKVILLGVEGAIKLSNILQIKNSNLTIDGSFAPGAGAWFEGRRVEFLGSNILVQDMLFLGNDPTPDASSDSAKIGNYKQGDDVDGLYFRRCAFMNGRDETISTTTRENGATQGPRAINITLDGVIVAHPVGDINGAHHFGVMLGDGTENFTVVNSLFSSVTARTPFIREHTKKIEVINNVIYNSKENQVASMSTETHVIGNVFRRGPYSGAGLFRPVRNNGDRARLYIEDNIISNGNANDKIYHGSDGTRSTNQLFTPSSTPIMASDKVLDHVLSTCGPRQRNLALNDRFVHKTIAEVRNLTGPATPPMYPGPVPSKKGKGPLQPSDYIPAGYKMLYPNDTSLEQVISSGDWKGYQVWERVAAWQTQ